MGVGTDLIAMQDLGLEISRQQGMLSSMPELKEIAKKRATLAKLRAEQTKLMAQRKDAQTDLDDLEAEAEHYKALVVEAQTRSVDPSDKQAFRELQDELALCAKKIDRCDFNRGSVEHALQEAKKKESAFAEYIGRFEQDLLADARRAKQKAEVAQSTINESQEKIDVLRKRVPADILDRFDAAAKRFRGLGVERLEGKVPTICRTALQAASMDELRRAGDIAECPYCHRIIVLNTEE